jgi:four helix bundle protein
LHFAIRNLQSQSKMKYRHLDKLAKLIMDFNVDVMKCVDKLKQLDERTELLIHQLLRVMLAAGSSYRWGRRADNKREFVNRLLVSQAEHEETVHWLTLVSHTGLPGDWPAFIATGQKIDKVLTASLKRASEAEKE